MSTNAAEATTAIDDRVRVASAVRAHYAAAGLSASALAREIGMSQSKMSRRTTAAEPFDIDELSAIARVLEVDLSDLITGANLPVRPLRATGGAGQRRGLYLLDDTEGLSRSVIDVKQVGSGVVTDMTMWQRGADTIGAADAVTSAPTRA